MSKPCSAGLHGSDIDGLDDFLAAQRRALRPDYRAILIGYIQIVGDAEGVDFIPSEGEASPHLTANQLRILRELAKLPTTG